MITVVLYKMNKRSNSTKQPDAGAISSSVSINALLLENTSIINPTLIFQQPANDNVNLNLYNYAYISDFGRYYFITNITHDTNSIYTIYLATDVLASFRTSIRNSSQYVVRSSSSSDDNIVDTLYPTKPFSTYSNAFGSNTYNQGDVHRLITSNNEESIGSIFYFNYGLQYPTNAVCFGVIGSSGVGANYYVATESNFIDFMTNVFALIPSDMGSMADGVKKLLVDLNQYIVSVVLLPVMPHSSNLGSLQSSVRLGSYTVNCTCYSFTPGADYETYFLKTDLSLPQHPNIATHSYYAMPPYSRYTLDFFPMGSVPLDTAKLYGRTTINVMWSIDYVTGMAIFRVGYFGQSLTPSTFVTLYTDVCQVGIPIPLSQLKVDTATGFGLSIASAVSSFMKNQQTNQPPILDTASNVINNWGQSARDFISAAVRMISGDKRKMVPASESERQSIIGNVFDGNTNVLDQIIDYAGNIFGQVYTKGSTGTYTNLIAGRPSVRGYFIDQCDTDNARFGSPLYQIKTLSTLSGFCICKNANIQTFSETHLPLNHERSAINSMLNSGVYLE